jgi:uncharacterized protein (DUF302 family)
VLIKPSENNKSDGFFFFGPKSYKNSSLLSSISFLAQKLIVEILDRNIKENFNMSYYFTKGVQLSFNDAVEKVRRELDKEGFFILSEIDITEMLNKELGVDFKPYTILGACSSIVTYRAIQRDKNIGTILPCNIVVQQKDNGVTVTAEDPVVKMKAVLNEKVAGISNRVQKKLKKVMERV